MKVIPLLIYLLTGLILFLAFRIKKNKLRMTWLLEILRFFLPIITKGLFGQIFLLLITLFECRNGHSYVSEDLVCREGKWFYYHFPFVLIAMILHIIISFLSNALFYKSIFILSDSDVLKETNSLTDISLLFTKFSLIILFILEKQSDSGRWAFLSILIFITGFNAYLNLYFPSKLNKTLLVLNILFSLIVFFGFYSLFVGNMLQFLGFNGSIYFYLAGIILIFFSILLLKKKDIDYVLLDYKMINNPNDYVNYILKYYRMITNKQNTRNNMTILKSYLETIESNCIDKMCPLKIYLNKLSKGIDCQYLLYQYLDKLFKYGKSKFKNNYLLLNSYAMFLIVRMHNKKQSILVINSIITDGIIPFIRNYNIFRCKKLINNWPSLENTFYYNYKNKLIQFKENINKTVKLYYEFWSLLYGSKFHHSDHFSKLYEIGSEIMKLDKEIEEMFEVIIKSKTKNIEIYNLYINFIENILNNEEKYQKSQKLKNSIFSDSFQISEKNYANFNMDIFKQNSLAKYLLISAKKKDLGIILDCSASASSLFGYTTEELIGMHINNLIPDIFHEKHNEILSSQINEENINLFETLFQRKEYKPSLIERNFFGILKSRFIKSFKGKIYYLKTEENIIGYIVEILHDIPYMRELIENLNINNCNVDTRCCILTNDNFLIYSFTPNTLEQLGLSYRYINSNNSIIPYIKQLNDDYLNIINNANIKNNSFSHINLELIPGENNSELSEIKENTNNNITPEIKKIIKKNLINKKYNKKCPITWRINIKKTIKNEDNNKDNNKLSRISHRGSNYDVNNILDENKFEIKLLMEIEKISFKNHLLGYYFYFSKLIPPETKNFMSYSVKNINNYNQNEEIKQLIKYKAIIKPLQNQSIINSNNNQRISSTPKNKQYNFNNKLDLKNKNFSVYSNNVKEESPKLSPILNKYASTSYEIYIDEEYIPKSQKNFSFDSFNMCYNLEKNNDNSISLITYLHNEAMNKLKQYQEYLDSLKKKEEEETYESESEDDNTSESNENSDSSNLDKEASNINNISLQQVENKLKLMYKSLTVNNKTKSKFEKISPIMETHTLKAIKEEKENHNEKSHFKNIIDKNKGKMNSRQSNVSFQSKKIQENNYYKVNISKIHYMIFDFNRDMIVEGKKDEKNLTIENIITNARKKNSLINVGKDEGYPFISLRSNKKENKMKNKNNLLDNVSSKIDEEKAFTNKISDAINNKNEEKTIKVLKIYSILFFVIIIFLSIIILIINFNFYNQIKEILLLYKSILRIKYGQAFGYYCVREEILLNFNVSNINGGIYYKFPAKNRTKYMNLIRNRFIQYFKESQDSLIQILSSRHSFSKDTTKNFTQTILSSENRPPFLGKLHGDIISNLIQYNSVFGNLASYSFPINQKNPDIFHFMNNGLNYFSYAISITIDKFYLELKWEKQKTFILFFLTTFSALIIFIIFIYFMVISYISSVKSRINYMKVFYGINIDSIKALMLNCEKLMKELQRKQDNKEEDIDPDLEDKDKNSIIKNIQIEKNSINRALINNGENKKNSIISINNKIYIIFYIIFMLILCSFFPLMENHLYKISNKSINYANFLTDFNKFHSVILDIFNEYREFIFDNKTHIRGKDIGESLNEKLIQGFNMLATEIKIIDKFIFLKGNEKLVEFIRKDLCSFYITDYFNSIEECRNQYSLLLNYDFEIFTTNFLQNLRNIINILEYKLETEPVKGELAMYETDKWAKWNSNTDETGKKIIFRLDLYNNETLHSEMNLIFVNIFIPYLDDIRKKCLDYLDIEGDDFYFILYFCLIILIVILIYIAYLYPMLRYLNSSIYRTKNMLLLIPMKILSSQTNIKELLNLY